MRWFYEKSILESADFEITIPCIISEKPLSLSSLLLRFRYLRLNGLCCIIWDITAPDSSFNLFDYKFKCWILLFLQREAYRLISPKSLR